MKNNCKTILFLFIILIAAFLRLYQLGQIPPSPDWDEVALGYNAYSILKTGKDEYGNFLPLSIRSFDDYKPPLYTYLTVPSVALFGLSVWSTRLPSAVMGIIAVIGVYFFVTALLTANVNTKNFSIFNFQFSNKFQISNFKFHLACLSSMLLAISPWHIQFSRIAFEANVGVTVVIWALVYFYKGLRNKVWLLFSAILFGLGLYTYHSERVFIPFMLLLLFFLHKKELLARDMKKTFLVGICIGSVIVLPLIPVMFEKTALLRFSGTSSFHDQLSLLKRTINKIEEDRGNKDIVGELIDNRRFVYAKTIISGYLSHFSLKWLFLTGDNPRHHAPDMGLLYFWELPFLLYGIVLLAKNREKISGLLFGWILIAPLAAAPTSGLPHAVRTLVFLPVFQIIISIGLLSFFQNVLLFKMPIFSRRLIVGLSFSMLGFIVLFNFFYYVTLYFVYMNKQYSQYWQYGMREAVAYTESVKDTYQKVVVSTGLEQSYMFYLFYTKYDPGTYLKEGGTKSGSFAEKKNSFDKYEFRPLDWNNEVFDGKTLYVGSSIEIPHGNNAHITFLNGTPAIEIKDRKD